MLWNVNSCRHGMLDTIKVPVPQYNTISYFTNNYDIEPDSNVDWISV